MNICFLSTVYWKDENKEKRGREWPIFKKCNLIDIQCYLSNQLLEVQKAINLRKVNSALEHWTFDNRQLLQPPSGQFSMAFPAIFSLISSFRLTNRGSQLLDVWEPLVKKVFTIWRMLLLLFGIWSQFPTQVFTNP